MNSGANKRPRRKGKERDEDATLHDDIVAEYVKQGWKTHGFMAAMQTAYVGYSCAKKCVGPSTDTDGFDAMEDASCTWRYVKEEIEPPRRVVPDAYRVHQEAKLIEVLEVDINHHTSNEKLNMYAELWFAMDSYEVWHMTITLADRFGVERVFSACDLWYADALEVPPVLHVRKGPAAFRSPTPEDPGPKLRFIDQDGNPCAT